MRNRKIIAALLVAAVLVAAFAVSVNAQTFYQKFENIWAKSITTTGNATIGGDLTVIGTLTGAPEFDGGTVSDPTTFGSTLVVSGATHLVGAVTADSTAVISGNTTISGTSNLVGNTTVAGTFAANGDSLTVAKTMNLARQGAIAVTDGSTITPTGTFQELTAAGAVGASVAAPAAAGQLVILFNSTANAITITDTTGIALATDAVLGQNDSVTIISTAAGQWMEVSRSNN